MTEEEKKAIGNIEEMIESIFKCEDDEEFVCDVYDGSCLKTALNLIQKQDTEINKLKKINDLMSKSILNYDDQLEINYYKNKEHVKETFTEYAMKEDK